MRSRPSTARRARSTARARSATPCEDLGLTIRVGLHTGEVEISDGDIHGIAVHVAARIMALAGPREVLVSGVIPPLVLGSRIAFDDRGEPRVEGCSRILASIRRYANCSDTPIRQAPCGSV